MSNQIVKLELPKNSESSVDFKVVANFRNNDNIPLEAGTYVKDQCIAEFTSCAGLKSDDIAYYGFNRCSLIGLEVQIRFKGFSNPFTNKVYYTIENMKKYMKYSPEQYVEFTVKVYTTQEIITTESTVMQSDTYAHFALTDHIG